MKRKYKEQVLKLRDNHTWKAPPGHKIVVLDRGAVRFNFPESWMVVPESDALKLYDVAPPDDNCRLSVSFMRTPPVDWSELPLAGLLESVMAKDDDPSARPVGKTVRVPRQDVEIVWMETSFEDPVEHREGRSRVAVARGRNIHAIFTLDFWPEDAPRLAAMWQEVMRSVELGRYVSDPTKGDVLH